MQFAREFVEVHGGGRGKRSEVGVWDLSSRIFSRLQGDCTHGELFPTTTIDTVVKAGPREELATEVTEDTE